MFRRYLEKFKYFSIISSLMKNLRAKTYYLALSIPLLYTIGVISFTMKTSSSVSVAKEGLMLSPIRDIVPLIFILSLFAIGYTTFIIYLFKGNFKNKILKKH
jgi:hypothetical protein